jgi:hypothetical protein
MTTFTQDKKITLVEIKKALKEFLQFSVRKIGENAQDAFITFIFMTMTIAVIITLQNVPITMGEMTAYILTIFVLIILQRVIQDFDDSYTTDELADEISSINKSTQDIADGLLQMAETIENIVDLIENEFNEDELSTEDEVSEDEFNARLRGDE